MRQGICLPVLMGEMRLIDTYLSTVDCFITLTMETAYKLKCIFTGKSNDFTTIIVVDVIVFLVLDY